MFERLKKAYSENRIWSKIVQEEKMPKGPKSDKFREKLLEELLDEKNKEYRNSIDSIVENLSNDEIKLRFIDKVNSYNIEKVFKSIKTEESRKKAFEKLTLESKVKICKATYIPEMNSEMDEYRDKTLEELKESPYSIFYSSDIVEKLSSDDLKVKYFELLDNSYVANKVLKSISRDESKIKLFEKILYNENISPDVPLNVIFSSMENKQYKDNLMNKMFREEDSDFLRYFISSLPKGEETDNYIFNFFAKYNNDNIDPFSNLSTDEVKLQNIPEKIPGWEYATFFEAISSDEARQKYIDIVYDKIESYEMADFIRAIYIPLDAEYDESFVKIIDKEIAKKDEVNVLLVSAAIAKLSSNDLKLEKIIKFPSESFGLQCSLLQNIPSDMLINKFETVENTKLQSAMILAMIEMNELPENIAETWKMFDNNNDKEIAKIKRNEVLKSLKKTQSESTNFYIMNALLEYPDISLDEIKVLGGIIERFSYTNSNELRNLQYNFLPSILKSKNPIESFDKVEKIFLKNNLPMMAKIYQCFKELYPDFSKENTFDFSEESRISPELNNPTQTRRMQVVEKNANTSDMRFQIIYNDLIRIAVRSNNRSLKEYIDNIEKGNTLFLGITKGVVKYDELDENSKEILNVFSAHLNALYEKTQVYEKNGKITENLSPIEKIKYYNEIFKPTERYSLPDRIVRSFAYQAGYDSFEQLKNETINTVRNKEKISLKRAKELEQGNVLTLEKGDFIRCIGTIESFGSSLNNGNVCKEFLGPIIGSSNSDTTPLDIDFTIVEENGKKIYNNIAGTPTGFGFGNIYLILKKDNPEINITRDSQGNLIESEYKPDKIEMFGSKTSQGGYENHWAARTGLASSDIDYILFKEPEQINPTEPYLDDGSVNYMSKSSNNDLAILKNEIVKNGFYIPVVDFSGKLIFTPKEYEELKDKMQGLSYFGSKEYKLGKHSNNDYIEQLKVLISDEREDIKIQSNKVYGALKESLENMPNENLTVKNKMDINITEGTVEILETGSSARGTNIPYEYDFDYIVRVDASNLKKEGKLLEINKAICDELDISNVPDSNFRDVEAKVVGVGKIDLDITYVQKTNKSDYSTEMAAKDRIDTIGKIDPAMKEEVVANIVLAKMLMKKSGCYKPRRKSTEQGGLGGVGIENWIVQNGGTLESAARSFMETAEGKTFDEFIKIYHVHDYGKNHVSEIRDSYPYNDFVFDNMNSTGYEKMQEALVKYLDYVDGKVQSLPEIDDYISTIRKKADDNKPLTVKFESKDNNDFLEIDDLKEPVLDYSQEISNISDTRLSNNQEINDMLGKKTDTTQEINDMLNTKTQNTETNSSVK